MADVLDVPEDGARLAFLVEWFDTQAEIVRRFQFTFHKADGSIEMWDLKNRKPFLKKTKYPSLSERDLCLGAKFTIYARQLKIVDYADEYTRKNVENRKCRSLILVKPDAYHYTGNILSAVSLELTVMNVSMIKLSIQEAREFLYISKEYSSTNVGFEEASAFLSSDVMTAMEVIGDPGGFKRLKVLGPEDPEEAKETAPGSLRAKFGSNRLRNSIYSSEPHNPGKSEEELAFFFQRVRPTTAIFTHCSCAVILPHAFNHAGEIIELILQNGFEISALQLFVLDKLAAAEFLEIYKTVLPEFPSKVERLSEGRCLALEIRHAENAVEKLRDLVGPHDPTIARHLRPSSIRAKFGEDRAANAIHCTDLIEDGVLESEFFFNILHNQGP